MSGQINISSDQVEQTIALLNDSIESVETNASSYVNDNYNVLQELGLVDKSVTTVKRQINDIVKSQTKVIKDLNDHIETYLDTENEIVDFINNYYSTKESAKIVNVDSDYKEADLDEFTEGKNITKGEIARFIRDMNPEIEEILLKNLNKQAKRFDTTTDELLFDPKRSGLLVEILKKLCGDTNMDIDVSNSIKTASTQKSLVVKVATTALEIVNGALWASLAGTLPYLKASAKEKKMKVEDLVYKEENKNALRESLDNLYLGKGTKEYTPTLNEINSFRYYVNNLSDRYNSTPEQFLSNSNNIDIMKRGM